MLQDQGFSIRGNTKTLLLKQEPFLPQLSLVYCFIYETQESPRLCTKRADIG